ncbi:UNVERIFIED_CONTAM: hypothetical protein Slati_4491400 [Sesamum latifolium]|uniref:Uncharacterized protein n=1 Tax=Sesamum latifolium TaxID=2727402 RepID=A0AAW2SS28_9LAMI
MVSVQCKKSLRPIVSQPLAWASLRARSSPPVEVSLELPELVDVPLTKQFIGVKVVGLTAVAWPVAAEGVVVVRGGAGPAWGEILVV